MAHKIPPSPLAIVGSPAPSAPPRPLGEAGTELWTTIQGEYAIADVGSVELLLQSCALADRIAGLAAEIERTGLMIPTKEGSRSNPLLKEEIGARSLLISDPAKARHHRGEHPTSRTAVARREASACLLIASLCTAPTAAV